MAKSPPCKGWRIWHLADKATKKPAEAGFFVGLKALYQSFCACMKSSIDASAKLNHRLLSLRKAE